MFRVVRDWFSKIFPNICKITNFINDWFRYYWDEIDIVIRNVMAVIFMLFINFWKIISTTIIDCCVTGFLIENDKMSFKAPFHIHSKPFSFIIPTVNIATVQWHVEYNTRKMELWWNGLELLKIFSLQ